MKILIFLGAVFVVGSGNHAPDDTNEQQQLGSLHSVQRSLNLSFIQENSSNFNAKGQHSVIISSDNFTTQNSKPLVIEAQENCTGFIIFVDVLDIDPINDVLQIFYGNVSNVANVSPEIYLTGKLKASPLKIKIANETTITVNYIAETDGLEKYSFFLRVYDYGNITQLPLPPEKNETITEDDINKMVVSLTVPKIQQTNETWDEFRQLFCNATNMYILQDSINLELCQSDNVTLFDIAPYAEAFPDSEDCIQVMYVISLFSQNDDINEKPENLETLNTNAFSPTRIPQGMNVSQLETMWDQYGRMEFKLAGFKECVFPNSTFLLVLWIGISLGVAILVLLIVLTLCRCKAFREHFPWMSESKDDEKMLKTEFFNDHTMIPSPYQAIPEYMPEYPPPQNFDWDSLHESRSVYLPNDFCGTHNPTFIPNGEDRKNPMPDRDTGYVEFQN